MILEYREDGEEDFIWHMIEADYVAKSYFDVKEDMKILSEKFGDSVFDNFHEIHNIAKKMMNRAGYCSHFYTYLHAENKEKITDIKEIVMIVLDRSRGTEIHFFVSDYPFRIYSKDGTITEESIHFKF